MDETKDTDDFTRDAYKYIHDTKRYFWDVYPNLIQAHLNYLNSEQQQRKTYWTNDKFVDPDQYSHNLYQRHLAAWRRGPLLRLDPEVQSKGDYHLLWKREQLGKPNIRFGSDTIFTDFIGCDEACKPMFQALKNELREENYRAHLLNYTRECYQNIGGFIIFPRISGSINQARGDKYSPLHDRFDLTLDCIRRYYEKRNPADATPLETTFAKEENIAFFNLFNSFKDYVDFFCLQDLVNGDYTRVINLMGDTVWVDDTTLKHALPRDNLPRDKNEYTQWLRNQKDFITRRTARINGLSRAGFNH